MSKVQNDFLGTYVQPHKVAILVDGAFYRRRAYNLFGDKSASERADELMTYCHRHLSNGGSGQPRSQLYRIFYYDCPPLDKCVFNPLTQKSVDLAKSSIFAWSNEFYEALSNKRLVALRMGELQEGESSYQIRPKQLKRLLRGDMAISELQEKDLFFNEVQKGVDMRIGLDIASIAYKRLADTIVLISGDSDFVPAAKHARREGIDFILDPMWQKIRPTLNRHIDGLRSCVSRTPSPETEPLCVKG